MSQHLKPRALVMAGGTGGHIFPGLAVAQALRDGQWDVAWLGAPNSMESRIIPPHGFALHTLAFGGVRGKGLVTKLLAPLRLVRATLAALQVMRRLKPNVVVGLGGFITVPGALAAWLSGRPVLLHEQNAIAGLSNRLIGLIAKRKFVAFPSALSGGEWIGNPLRAAFLQASDPAERYDQRTGPLRLLVLGGSLGAAALNDLVPQALAMLPAGHKPFVVHQSGEKHLSALQASYAAAGIRAEDDAAVQATLCAFIDDVAGAMQTADLVICRAGASTVTEVSAVGVAALFVPFPHAVDDHQTANAQFLVSQDAAWLRQQRDFTPQQLADFLMHLDREQLKARAIKARSLAKTGAVDAMVTASEACIPS